MVKFSRRGKPLCSRCRKVARYTIRHASGGRVVYAYQCAEHKHASSQPFDWQRKAFTTWLVSCGDVVVGRSADEGHCPLAHFYSLSFGVPCEVTAGEVCDLLDGHVLLKLPAWAKAFILALDFTFAFEEVTGQQALKLLEEV